MNLGQNLGAIALLLAHRRQGVDCGERHLQPSRFILANRNAMTPRARCRCRLGKDTMFRTVHGSVGGTLRQPVRLHRHEKVGTKIMRGAIEFIDIAFPVAYVNAAFGRANERDGLRFSSQR